MFGGFTFYGGTVPRNPSVEECWKVIKLLYNLGEPYHDGMSGWLVNQHYPTYLAPRTVGTFPAEIAKAVGAYIEERKNAPQS
jgi:hypothetical protein